MSSEEKNCIIYDAGRCLYFEGFFHGADMWNPKEEKAMKMTQSGAKNNLDLLDGFYKERTGESESSRVIKTT